MQMIGKKSKIAFAFTAGFDIFCYKKINEWSVITQFNEYLAVFCYQLCHTPTCSSFNSATSPSRRHGMLLP